MRSSNNSLLYLLVLFLFTACTSPTPKSTSTSLTGVWTSLGSGRILHIQANQYDWYDLTQISCLPIRSADLAELNDQLTLQQDTLHWKIGTVTYFYVRIQELPSLCQQKTPEVKKKDPLYNFEVFAETVREHYAFMALNQINWDSLYQIKKQTLRANPSDSALYQALSTTLEALHDNHGYLEASDSIEALIEASIPPSSTEEEQLREYGDFEIADLIAKHYLAEDLTKDSWLMRWGKINPTLGYVQIKSMWLYANLSLADSLVKTNGYVDTYVDAFHQMNEDEYIELEKLGARQQMKRVMSDLKDTEQLILDVRFNGGGQDAVSFEILRYFTGEKVKAFEQHLRHGQQFSPSIPIYLDSISTPYQKPVYILTSRQTGSAAEAFTLASLSLQQFHRIGSPTAGAMSTALEKRLPNGWHFALSNEINRDAQGEHYENRGIPADFTLDYPEDRQTFFRQIAADPEADQQQILKAIQALQNQ